MGRSRRTAGRAVVAVASLGAALVSHACGAGARDAASTGVAEVRVDTVGGVVHVRNRGTPARGRLTEVASLGGIGGSIPAPDEFGRITGVVADADGLIYVADATTHEIRVFREDGRLVRRIGREGGGPGEFRALTSLAWLGDRLAVLDPGNGRLGLLSATGEWLGQRGFMALTGNVIRLYPAGAEELYMPLYRADAGGSGLVLVRQMAAGPADTLPVPRREGGPSLGVVCRHNAGGGISAYTASLAPRYRWTPASGARIAGVWSAAYRIAFTTAAGDTVRVIERDLPPRPVSDADWAREEAAFRDFLDRFDDERCEPSRLPRPDEQEIVRGMFFDAQGRLWIERRTADGLAFDAFDREGRLLGTVPIPDRLERVPPYIRGDRLYLVVTDSLNVEHVEVFEISGIGVGA